MDTTLGKSNAHLYLTDLLKKSNDSKMRRWCGRFLTVNNTLLSNMIIISSETRAYVWKTILEDRKRIINNTNIITDKNVRSLMLNITKAVFRKYLQKYSTNKNSTGGIDQHININGVNYLRNEFLTEGIFVTQQPVYKSKKRKTWFSEYMRTKNIEKKNIKR